MSGVANYGPDEFAAEWNVPRGTMRRIERHAELLETWSARLNLVAASTLSQRWTRHFRDSAQLVRLTEPGLRWLDIGAGAGFPSLVLAAMEHGDISAVESVAKKCAFLQAVAADAGIEVTIVNARVETMTPVRADVIVARAAAPLAKLFDWGYRHMGSATRWVLPKGRQVVTEIEVAREQFDFEARLVPSVTDPDAAIVVATHVRRQRR